VRDESDALWLLDNARLKSAKYHKDGEVRDLALNFEKQKGSPRNIVQVEGIEKSMSINQFKMRPLRELEKTHLTRSQIVKAKVFTPQQLNKYIGAGILQVVRHGRKIFISRADIVRLIKSNLKD
ncbi:MAG: hypothetical protein Q7R93_05390, partial [bacterium]|nr:hypothetical protein [bacterium]